MNFLEEFFVPRVETPPKMNPTRLQLVAHTTTVRALSFGSQFGRIYATGSDDATVYIWAIGKQVPLLVGKSILLKSLTQIKDTIRTQFFYISCFFRLQRRYLRGGFDFWLH